MKEREILTVTFSTRDILHLQNIIYLIKYFNLQFTIYFYKVPNNNFT